MLWSTKRKRNIYGKNIQKKMVELEAQVCFELGKAFRGDLHKILGPKDWLLVQHLHSLGSYDLITRINNEGRSVTGLIIPREQICCLLFHVTQNHCAMQSSAMKTLWYHPISYVCSLLLLIFKETLMMSAHWHEIPDLCAHVTTSEIWRLNNVYLTQIISI